MTATQNLNLPVAIDDLSPKVGAIVYLAENGLAPYLEHIRSQVANEVPDLTTVKGRNRIASLAAQVARSKTAIEKPGREYLKELKAQPKLIEKQLREFVLACDELRDATRKPLTDWERDQAARQEFLQAKVDYFNEEYQASLANMPYDVHERADFIKDVLTAIKEEPVGEDFCELREAGEQAKKDVIDKMTLAYQAAIIESERQRKAEAQAEQERLAREKLIAEEAAAQAKADAEAASKAQIEQAERDKAAAEAREQQRAEQAERDRRAAIEQAERQAQQAAADERARIEAKQRAEQAERDRRAADLEHRKIINNAILSELVAIGVSEDIGKTIITKAARGELGGLVINY